MRVVNILTPQVPEAYTITAPRTHSRAKSAI